MTSTNRLFQVLFALLSITLVTACERETTIKKSGESKSQLPVEYSAQTKPNILFVLVDDMGYHQVGAYGQSKIKTPTLDHLAAAGIRFTQVYAGNTVCSPSRVSLFTGRDGRILHDNSNVIKLRKQDVTFAHVLKEAGYETGLFGKYSIGEDLAETGPLKMGFDTWYGMDHILEGHRQHPTFLWRDDVKFEVKPNLNGAKGAYAQELFTDETIKFIQQDRDRPFFAFLAYSSPHAELAAPDEFLEQYSGKFEEIPYTGMTAGEADGPYASYYPEAVQEPNATMAAMITALDTYIGRIYKVLEEKGIADNTMIIFSSDNGPHDEGGAKPEFFEAAKPYRGMKRDLYDGGIHVPMIVHWPAAIKKARVDDTPWAFADVLPTFADLAGISLEDIPRVKTNGVSIKPLLSDKPEPLPERILYWEFGRQIGDPNSGVVGDAIQAARKGNWKAVRYGTDEPIRIYDIINDPGETTDIAGEQNELLEEFSELFERHKARDS